MNQDFDFNELGQKMPYTVPYGFFDTFESKMVSEVLETTDGTRTKQSKIKDIKLWITGLSAAAALALLVIVGKNLFKHPIGNDDFTEVENAFCKLSPEDQTYLLEIYESDIFINE